MKCMEDLKAAVALHGPDPDYDWTQHGEVYARRNEDASLIIFNYKPKAMYDNRWNWLERVSRGLILNALTGEVVARPFDKFWNYGERGDFHEGKTVTDVREKMDGSLGILYLHRGQFRIATRGSFDSRQAKWATEYLLDHHSLIGLAGVTLLFEIVYPENRVVVDYAEQSFLSLLGVRRIDGDEVSPAEVDLYADRYGFRRPACLDRFTPEQLRERAAELTANEEGWVVLFTDGSRCKIKGAAYIAIHRIVTLMESDAPSRDRRLAEMVFDGRIDDLKDVAPKRFLAVIETAHVIVTQSLYAIVTEVEDAHIDAPKTSRKDYAIWCRDMHQRVFSCLMLRYDDRSYDAIARKMVLSEF